MEWQKLLSKSILCDSESSDLPAGQAGKIFKDGRSEFQRDFDRIVFSPAFRLLQDKTQVFPLPESDFVHNRLTHSLEVSCVGRSLGTLVGSKILQRHPELKKEFFHFHFGEIVAAACLAHDIGNPPFGHSGEDAISEYFKNGNGKTFNERLNEKQWNDLTRFEGNAQGFRIITKLQNPNIKGGLKLTCATLAAFAKYPGESFSGSASSPTKNNKLYKKFSFFQSEKDLFAEVAYKTGLQKRNELENYLFWHRHPLVYLVEAADDICYHIMDLEDGFRLGLLSFKETEAMLIPFIKKESLKFYKERSEDDKIGYLRAKSINSIISALAEVFLDEEKNILSGKFESDLISVISFAKHLKKIKNISKEKIYSHESVVEREAAGYEVLGGLLDAFSGAVNDAAEGKLSPKGKTLIKLLPKQFLGSCGKRNDDLYIRLLKIIDFVSGMTDSYAVSLYRKIKGISLPGW